MSHIHIPDGVLPVWIVLAGWALAVLGVGIASRTGDAEDVRRRVPLLGVVSALVLVAMSSEIVPIAYHVNLTILAGILLGPALSVVSAFVVVVMLALLGHGGITVIGLNTVMIATEMLLGRAFFRTAVRMTGRGRAALAAGISTALALAVTTSMLVGVVALAGSAGTARDTGAFDPVAGRFADPLSQGLFRIGLLAPEKNARGGSPSGGLSVSRFAIVVYTLGPLGWLIEALVVAGIVGYVARVRPSLVFEGAQQQPRGLPPGDAEVHL